MRQPKCIYLCMALSSTVLLPVSLHAHDGDLLHVPRVSGLPSSMLGEFEDLFDAIFESDTNDYQRPFTPEQPSFYSRCKYNVRQWALSLVCRYYNLKERYQQIHYWIMRRIAAQRRATPQLIQANIHHSTHDAAIGHHDAGMNCA